MNQRLLIVNADDLGISPGVNRGIIEAHVRGIVTSASVMTRHPAANEAADLAKEHPRLGFGLHVDLGEWVCRQGEWEPVYEVVPLEDPMAVEREILGQLAEFRRLLGHDPDHLDSHQHVHRDGPARQIMCRLARELEVPLRHFSRFRYDGGFYGQGDDGSSYPELISPEALLRIIDDLPEGSTELTCHPGIGEDLNTMYRRERELELRALCDHRVRRRIEQRGIRLCTFPEAAALR